MKTARLFLLVSILCSGAHAAERVMDLAWPPSGPTPFLLPSTGDASPVIEIVNSAAGALSVPLLRIEAPAIARDNHALRGWVRHEEVEPPAYIEMWNRFPDGAAYFSRTLDTAGPTAHLQGTAEWRLFLVPFSRKPDAPLPERIEVNLILPGRGRVQLRDLELVEGETFADLLSPIGVWWNERDAGRYGGMAGGAIGLGGLLIGVLGGLGRARRFVLGLCRVLIGLGIACLALGLCALIAGQPFSVFYPFLLIGLVLTAGLSFVRSSLIRAYEARELRRMHALDTDTR